ncbi:hypothetical protein QM298_05000 [Pseudomonas mendocina]|nr:hypothetical protein [Pseudomonas mendocina]MDV5860326.1 hypothetical protein [Pseudomonas mendocina]
MNLYDGHRVEDHSAFLLDDLLPAIVGYADSKGVPTEVVAFAAFLAMATIIRSKGVGRDVIIRAVDAMHLPTHEAPETMQ